MATAACAAMPTTSRSVRSVNTPGSGWPKKSPPITSPERAIDRHRQVAAHRQVARRHAVVRGHLAVARVLRDVVDADDALAAEGRAEQRGGARVPELLERLARRAESVYSV